MRLLIGLPAFARTSKIFIGLLSIFKIYMAHNSRIFLSYYVYKKGLRPKWPIPHDLERS